MRAENHQITTSRGQKERGKNSQLDRKQVFWILFLLCCALAMLQVSTSTTQSLVILGDGLLGVAPVLSRKQGTAEQLGNLDDEREQKISLPIWGDSRGIDFAAIDAYFQYSAAPENKGAKYNILYPPHLYPHEFPSPNVLYIFGNRQSTSPTFQVHVDRYTKRPAPGFLQSARYRPWETLLTDSLLYIVANITNDNHRWHRLKQHLNSSEAGLPLILNLDDHRHCSEWNLFFEDKLYDVPIWTVAAANPRHDYCHYSFPLPTYSTIALVKELEEASRDRNHDMNFHHQDEQFSWPYKHPSVVWRGSSTGVPPLSFRTYKYFRNETILGNASNAMKDHVQRLNRHLRKDIDPRNGASQPIRLQMVYRAMNQSFVLSNRDIKYNTSVALLDIAYNPGIHQFYKRNMPYLKVREKISPMSNFQRYKAILDVDGNSWSERFAKLLCMNSVVVKVEPEFVDYFWHQIKPWVHYVPIKQDSSDLWEIAQYVVHHDEEMHGIAKNARQWCQDNMKYERLIEFVLDSMEFYVEMLDKNDPNWKEKWKELLHRDSKNRSWESLST
jgi:hypothetical protein